MTLQEFNRWYADYCLAFPLTEDFVSRGGNKPATLAKWFQVLGECELQDALAATASILKGTDVGIPAFREHTTPKHVATICQRLARERTAPARPRDTGLVTDEVPAKWSGSSVLSDLVEAAKRGEDIGRLAKKLMPVDRESEPRLRCLICKDRGHLRVWHPDSMAFAKRGELTPRRCYSIAIRCFCERGELWPGMNRGNYDKTRKEYQYPERIYNDEQWRICRGYSADDIADLCAFMDHLKPVGYVSAFDDYNNRD